MGAIGFLDDYLKIVRRSSEGLVARAKLLGQLSFGLALGDLPGAPPHFAVSVDLDRDCPSSRSTPRPSGRRPSWPS